MNYVDFRSLWSDFQSKLEEGKLHIVTELLYGLWRRRNEVVFEGKFKGPSIIFQLALHEVEVTKLAQEKPRESQASPTVAMRTLWRPPRLDYMKVNVDVAMDKRMGRTGIDIVVRNCSGEGTRPQTGATGRR
ncbi:uncharacterized protein LOC122291000 [Carya illinoinensis]|uniref:uncharacterized protein LOC122291000 n=1 Tax=Carya illinoinensis TaxID=32201 RepID=UPI001C71DFEE|nr:uncharacterized protein LOC122291000 [Carya illinoinensis]